jgi:hypothetical protein
MTNLRFLLVLACCIAFPATAQQPDASVMVRLASCNAATVRAAIDEMRRDPKTLQEPLMLFHAAMAERMTGRKEEAAFLFLAARLRSARQILFEKGDRPQLLAVMNMTVGPLVMPALAADPEMARRVVQRVIDWDRNTPDPFRAREAAKSGELKEKLAAIDTGLARLPEQLRATAGGDSQLAAAGAQAERAIETTYAERCGPGKLDPVDAETATTRIQRAAESFARTHPFVLERAGGTVKSVNVGSWRQGPSRLPSRLTVSVTPAAGKNFFAEIDAQVAVTADRKLGELKLALACVTDLWIGQRDAFSKDICTEDTHASKPSGAAAELRRFDLGSEMVAQPPVAHGPVCGFPALQLPADFAVFAAGAYTGREVGFQIDQSGHQATQMDVTVNSPDRPVVLMLGAYEPTIWNIVWSRETSILAVLVGGYHRQAVAGLEPDTPLLISTQDNKGPCDYFYISPDRLAPLNPLAKRVFGRPVDMVFPATKGKVVVGTALPADLQLITSPATTPESFYDRKAPIAGPAGLEDAVRKGLLRRATPADAEAWSEAVLLNSPKRDIPPMAGQGVPRPAKPPLFQAYVVLKPFKYPAGLYGGNSATFLIPKGVPRPEGDPGHSAVYDFNRLKCEGATCGAR